MDGHVRARCVVVLFMCLSYCVYALPRVVSWVTRVRCTYYEKMLAVVAAISSPWCSCGISPAWKFVLSLKSIRRRWSTLYWPRHERERLDPSFENTRSDADRRCSRRRSLQRNILNMVSSFTIFRFHWKILERSESKGEAELRNDEILLFIKHLHTVRRRSWTTDEICPPRMLRCTTISPMPKSTTARR